MRRGLTSLAGLRRWWSSAINDCVRVIDDRVSAIDDCVSVIDGWFSVWWFGATPLNGLTK